MRDYFSGYTIPYSENGFEDEADTIIKNNISYFKSRDSIKRAFGLIDLTSLNLTDTKYNITTLCRKVNEFHKIPRHIGISNVAGICVFPNFIPILKEHLSSRYVSIISVAGNFPHGQTFYEHKLQEIRMALDKGANEIDVVLPVGKFIEGRYEDVFKEISDIKTITQDKILKVILETGVLENPRNIYTASVLAMEAGADFIKSSTGKIKPAATPAAVYTMALAVRDFYRKNELEAGIKPAGGIHNAEHAAQYMSIVAGILGKKWLNRDHFRLGASKLANNLLIEITESDTLGNSSKNYF